MPSRPNDPGIPTLTQRAEPTLYTPPATDEADTPVLTERADDADDFPVLTDVAGEFAQDWNVDEAPAVYAAVQQAAAAPAATALLPEASVLTARLQAEVEQLMREALADAVKQMQTRMDAELPGIVERVLSQVKPG